MIVTARSMSEVKLIYLIFVPWGVATQCIRDCYELHDLWNIMFEVNDVNCGTIQ